MNSFNTGDGLCKLYVQARRTRGKYLPCRPDTQKLSQPYLHTLCIFHLYTYSAYTLKPDARLKTHKAPTNADSVQLMKCQTGSSNLWSRKLSFAVDCSVEAVCSNLDILSGRTFSDTSSSIQPSISAQGWNLGLGFYFQSSQASASSNRSRLPYRQPVSPAWDLLKLEFRVGCSTLPPTCNPRTFACPCRNGSSAIFDSQLIVFRTESSWLGSFGLGRRFGKKCTDL